MDLSRRQFLTRFATVSGMGAPSFLMQALRLARFTFAETRAVLPAKNRPRAFRSSLLGAGIAGLVTAISMGARRLFVR